MKKILSITVTILFLGNSVAFAQCACCSSVGCGDNSGGGSALVKQGKWLFSAVGRYSTYKPLSPNQLQKDATADTAFPVYNKSNQLTYTFSLTYGITDRLNVTATLPYNSITNIQVGTPGDITVQGTSKGWSNLKASVQYVLLQRQYCAGWEIIPSVGIIAPTGVHGNVGLDGTVFEDQFQPGADTWVPVMGLTADNTFGKVTLRGSANYVFASTDPKGNTDASLWNVDASAYFMLLRPHSCMKQCSMDSTKKMMMPAEPNFMVNVFAGTQVEHIGQDVVVLDNGSRVPNTNIGAFRVYANIGVVAGFHHRFFVPVSIALPVYQTFNGYQVKVNWRLNTGLSVIF